MSGCPSCRQPTLFTRTWEPPLTRKPFPSSFPFLPRYGLQKKADLSTTPLVWHEHSVNQAGWEAMWRLCSALLSWEGVFGEVCDKQNQAACIHKQMDHFSFTKVAMQNSRRDGDTLTMQIMRGKSVMVNVQARILC